MKLKKHKKKNALKVVKNDFSRFLQTQNCNSAAMFMGKLLHWSYSTANLEQFEERKKMLRFLRIVQLAKFMQKNLNVG